MVGASIPNSATVTSPSFTDTNPANNTSTVSITLSSPADVQVTKTASTNGGGAGVQTDTFVVTVKNNGPDTATSVVVADSVPSGYTVSSITPSCRAVSGFGADALALRMLGGSEVVSPSLT